jgi:hypothetical protein
MGWDGMGWDGMVDGMGWDGVGGGGWGMGRGRSEIGGGGWLLRLGWLLQRLQRGRPANRPATLTSSTALQRVSKNGVSPNPGVASQTFDTSSRWLSITSSARGSPGSFLKWCARRREKS